MVKQAIDSAQSLASLLENRNSERVVFAESCTSGMVAALLGQIPGISNWLCGSAVTYRESVKQDWLSVTEQTLVEKTAESIETSASMAIGVLQQTSEATYAAAVTGHLGPGAAEEIDGRIFIAVAKRHDGGIVIVDSNASRLKTTDRVERQYESAHLVLNAIERQLAGLVG